MYEYRIRGMKGKFQQIIVNAALNLACISMHTQICLYEEIQIKNKMHFYKVK